MSILTKSFAWLYAFSLKLYSADFCHEFSDEMMWVFSTAIETNKKLGALKLLAFFVREIRDFPGAIWRAYLRSGKGVHMNQNNLAWRPLKTRELLAGLALFILPIISPILKLEFI